MKQYTQIPIELLACIVEISSDLGYMLDGGIDEESMESIELLNNRIGTLLVDIERSKVS